MNNPLKHAVDRTLELIAIAIIATVMIWVLAHALDWLLQVRR